MWPWLLAGALVLLNVATILVVVVVVRLHVRADRQGEMAAIGVEPAGPADLDQIRGDVGELMRQLDRLADDIDTRVGRRTDALRRLLGEADARLAELQGLLNRPGAYVGTGGGPAGDSRRAEVIRLADQGLDTIEIARRTGLDIGEVDLVLHLHRPSRLEMT